MLKLCLLICFEKLVICELVGLFDIVYLCDLTLELRQRYAWAAPSWPSRGVVHMCRYSNKCLVRSCVYIRTNVCFEQMPWPAMCLSRLTTYVPLRKNNNIFMWIGYIYIESCLHIKMFFLGQGTLPWWVILHFTIPFVKCRFPHSIKMCRDKTSSPRSSQCSILCSSSQVH